MAKRSKLAARTKVATPKAKAAARRRLAERKSPLRGKLKVAGAEKSAAAKSTTDKNDGSALQALTVLLSTLPSLAIGAAAPAVRKTEQAIGQIDIASFIGALTAAIRSSGSGTKSAKRQLAEEAALLAAAVALIALRRKLPLMKIVGSGVPGSVLGVLSALRALKR